jgi:GNAT superfamily N-acetyltransferase
VYEIVPFTPERRAAVLDLLAELWSRDAAVNDAYMRWKYDANPYASGAIHVALLDGDVVGVRGNCGCRWIAGAGGGAIRVSMPADLVIAPQHRRRGLFHRLMDAPVTGGASYLFVTSAGAATRLGLERMGWGSIGRIARLVLDQRTVDLHGRARGRPFASFDRMLRWRRGRAGGGVGASATPRPDEMADLIARLPADGRIRHVRDRTYFAWRFGNPLSHYRFLFLGGARPEGYLVLQADAFGRYGPQICIVDWEATEPDGLAGLLRIALRYTRGWLTSTWVGARDERRDDLLRGAGFVDHTPADPLRYYPTILLRPGGAGAPPPRPWLLDGSDLLDAANWDVRLLYSDGC